MADIRNFHLSTTTKLMQISWPQNYMKEEVSTYEEVWLLNLLPRGWLLYKCSWHVQSALLKYLSIVCHRQHFVHNKDSKKL